jgi:hypothetical protein
VEQPEQQLSFLYMVAVAMGQIFNQNCHAADPLAEFVRQRIQDLRDNLPELFASTPTNRLS